jgi:bifunctional lysine-specific demethylase and histidyl-hydroxylase NO66
MDFDRFTAPLGEARFLAEHWLQRPHHFTGGDRPCFGWARMNEILGIAPHWTPGNIKLVLNSRPVDPTFYMDQVVTADGPRTLANPAKVAHFLAIGASLVANSVEQVAPEIRAVCDLLAARFTALASANIYCSFDGVQAFATHCDTHEVFALQCEGEKRWRLYASRAPDPVEHGRESQAEIDAARGPLIAEVRTRPGDLLYIPRGQYHDAVAEAGASLHVTFAVAPRTGRAMFRLLEEALREDPAFRAYLPPPGEAGGTALMRHLAGLADRIAATVRSPGFAAEVADAQARTAVPAFHLGLPERPRTATYARTGRAAAVERRAGGAVLVVGGRAVPLGPAFAAAEWALDRRAFGEAELDAHFPHVAEAIRRQLVALLVREGLLERYEPQL